MNKVQTTLSCAIVALLLLPMAYTEEGTTFRGEVSDSQCALNVHSLTKSHVEMLKSKSGAAGDSPSTCSLYCVANLGGKFVLSAKGHVYRLDNQDQPKQFVGMKVKLRGILNPTTETIHVTNIEAE
jgi:hypothetical protein